jgi:hypothetical protein
MRLIHDIAHSVWIARIGNAVKRHLSDCDHAREWLASRLVVNIARKTPDIRHRQHHNEG